MEEENMLWKYNPGSDSLMYKKRKIANQIQTEPKSTLIYYLKREKKITVY